MIEIKQEQQFVGKLYTKDLYQISESFISGSTSSDFFN